MPHQLDSISDSRAIFVDEDESIRVIEGQKWWPESRIELRDCTDNQGRTAAEEGPKLGAGTRPSAIHPTARQQVFSQVRVIRDKHDPRIETIHAVPERRYRHHHC